ncbi:hypothetical protein, partial [Umezakia ovalisporum]|uniref:hypothetical protein n=1 Tax=Umezakia ovalisporum TaxID=75695 RepID=UPI0035BAC07C
NGLRMSLTILGNEFIIIINYFVLILRPEFTIFWAIFITSFLTFNTCVNPQNPAHSFLFSVSFAHK